MIPEILQRYNAIQLLYLTSENALFILTKRDKIAIHNQDFLDNGIEIKALQGLPFVEQGLHRDGYYMFIIQMDGHFICEIDFNEVEIIGAGLLYVAPGQVHRYLKAENCRGWLLFVDLGCISKQFREIFDTFLNVAQYAALDDNDSIFTFADHLERLWSEKREQDDVIFSVIKSLVDAISGIIASKLLRVSTRLKRVNSPKYALANNFKQHIKENFKDCKQVKQYAVGLNVTPLYLNQVMKEITGFPASYWIHQEIILEAKRLLAHSTKDVQEIACDLGYEDYAYFSRFFKRNTGLTASAFRHPERS